MEKPMCNNFILFTPRKRPSSSSSHPNVHASTILSILNDVLCRLNNHIITHFAVQLVLFLRDRNVILHRALYGKRQVWINGPSIRIQIELLSAWGTSTKQKQVRWDKNYIKYVSVRRIDSKTINRWIFCVCFGAFYLCYVGGIENALINNIEWWCGWVVKNNTCGRPAALGIAICFAESFAEFHRHWSHSRLPIVRVACTIVYWFLFDWRSER